MDTNNVIGNKLFDTWLDDARQIKAPLVEQPSSAKPALTQATVREEAQPNLLSQLLPVLVGTVIAAALLLTGALVLPYRLSFVNTSNLFLAGAFSMTFVYFALLLEVSDGKSFITLVGGSALTLAAIFTIPNPLLGIWLSFSVHGVMAILLQRAANTNQLLSQPLARIWLGLTLTLWLFISVMIVNTLPAIN